VFFANGAALGSWVPHIPDAKQTLDLGEGMLGFALLGMAAGSLAGLPLSGSFTAKFGSRKTTTAAIVALLFVTPLPLLAPSLPVFAAALILLGTAIGAVDVAMNAQAIAIEARVGRAIMSSFHGMFSAGGLVGAAGAGAAMSFDIRAAPHLLASVALLSCVTLVAVRFLLPTEPAAAHTTQFHLPRGPLIALGVLTLCSLLAEGAIGDWSAVYLRDDLGADAGYPALGFVGISLAMLIGRFAGDGVVRRYGGSLVLGLGTGMAALIFAAALIAGMPFAALIGFAAVGLGLANAVPILFSAAGGMPGTPPELAIAAVSTAGYFGFLFGPPAIGLVAERFGLATGLGVIAVALAIVALGTAGALSKGAEKRWMVLSSAWK
jgi:predicted MFS family arabinose efflux permease